MTIDDELALLRMVVVRLAPNRQAEALAAAREYVSRFCPAPGCDGRARGYTNWRTNKAGTRQTLYAVCDKCGHKIKIVRGVRCTETRSFAGAVNDGHS
jgi:ribosomal protein L44E